MTQGTPLTPNQQDEEDWFLTGGGDMGVAIRAFDWGATPLGPAATWPSGLKTAVGLMLGASQPVYIAFGPELTSLYNDGYLPIVGTKHPAGLGTPFSQLWAEIWQDFQSIVEATMAGRAQHFVDLPIALAGRPGLPVGYFTFSYTPLRDDAGVVVGFYCAATETTNQVLAGERRAVDTQRLRRMLQQMPGFVALLSGPEHRYEYINDAYVDISGPRAFLGRTVREVFPELAGQGFYELLDTVFITGEPFVARELPIRLAGEIEDRFIDLLYEPVRDENGGITGIFVGGYDVSETYRSARDLRELNANLERQVSERAFGLAQMWAVSPDLLGALNSEGYFETSNPAWKSLLGWEAEEVARSSIWELLHPDDVETTRGGFALTQIGQPAIHFPNRYRHKDGTYRWISWVGVPQDGLVYCTGRDITDVRAQAAALADAQDALRQSQKMEAVGQLTGGIAHDFNNLLTGISGSLEMLQTRIAQGRIDVVDRYVNAAQGAAKRAAALTHRLLAFSRRQTLDPKSTDVNRLIGEMEELVRRTVGPEVSVEVVGAGGLWPTLVDPNQLENALLNLCINARDAMPEGGRITIETANRWLDDPAAAARDLPPGQYVTLSVTDTGAGMSPEVVARAFDPFYTTKPMGEGTGLGLSMVYGFVRQSGGQVRIYSEPDQGTTMSLYLPRDHAATEEGGSLPLQTRADPHGAGEVVLIVDDEPTIRMLIGEVLAEFGYAGIEAGDGPTGLKVLQSAAKIDLLITDVGLPGGINGRQLADAARVARPDLKVLFITGYAENAVVGNGHLAVGMQVLTKPFAMDVLAQRIRSIIES
jgi:PAS domain S-box-containing protein